jgi:hypothetical protein
MRRPDDDRQIAVYGFSQLAKAERILVLVANLGVPRTAQIEVSLRVNVARTDRDLLIQDVEVPA